MGPVSTKTRCTDQNTLFGVKTMFCPNTLFGRARRYAGLGKYCRLPAPVRVTQLARISHALPPGFAFPTRARNEAPGSAPITTSAVQPTWRV
ncbi:hypothetical protein [Hymenobacter terrenus]|uniref:hypothetical protein n=1 Tax=Hymenobacter terrenus TaxID=1629124 RepID=UPI0006193561|nr:hypothetical protein [Hymenobacter terrenus]